MPRDIKYLKTERWWDVADRVENKKLNQMVNDLLSQDYEIMNSGMTFAGMGNDAVPIWWFIMEKFVP
jgi:hypothetical protein